MPTIPGIVSTSLRQAFLELELLTDCQKLAKSDESGARSSSGSEVKGCSSR